MLYYVYQALKSTVVNRTCQSINGKSIKIKLTVPLQREPGGRRVFQNVLNLD